MRKFAFHELYNPCLQALHALGGSGTNQEIHDKVAQILALTDEEIAEPHKPGISSPTRIAYRLAWVRTWLKRYGLLENTSRGVWTLTQKGLSVSRVDGREVIRAVNEMVRQEKKQSQVLSFSDNGHVEEELVASDEIAAKDVWREELITVLANMPPSEFERLCQRILRESGFTQVEVSGRSGDGGIDGIGVVRIGGFLSFKVLFQCKRWQNAVGAGVVRDFRGAMMGRTEKGLIITTGNYTPAAIREATRDGAPEIDLVDGEQLIDKLKELSLGVSTKQVIVEQVTIDPDFFKNI